MCVTLNYTRGIKDEDLRDIEANKLTEMRRTGGKRRRNGWMEGMEIEVGRAEKFSQNTRITFISYVIVAVPRITLIQ